MNERCTQVEPLLSAHLDDELDASQTQIVEAHLLECESCLAELRELGETARVSSVSIAPDPWFVTRFRARRDEAILVLGWEGWRKMAVRLAPLAIAAALGAGTAVWWARDETLTELEARELGNDVVPAIAAEGAVETVLGIAFEPFPETGR